jgi:hypothetical protein
MEKILIPVVYPVSSLAGTYGMYRNPVSSKPGSSPRRRVIATKAASWTAISKVTLQPIKVCNSVME